MHGTPCTGNSISQFPFCSDRLKPRGSAGRIFDRVARPSIFPPSTSLHHLSVQKNEQIAPVRISTIFSNDRLEFSTASFSLRRKITRARARNRPRSTRARTRGHSSSTSQPPLLFVNVFFLSFFFFFSFLCFAGGGDRGGNRRQSDADADHRMGTDDNCFS